MTNTTKNILGFLIALVVLSSCSVEKKVARQFTHYADSIAVMVMFTPDVLLTNSKNSQLEGSFYYRDANENPDLLTESYLLPLFSDDSLLLPFKKAYLRELMQYKLKVYDTSNMEQFMQLTGRQYFIQLAQLEFQEYLTSYEDAITVGEQVYTKTFYLNGINFGSWFELSAVNGGDGEKIPVLFATHDLTDRWNGYFTQKFLTGEVEYRLQLDSITAGDVKAFVSYLGRLYAAYTFDYLMNREINRKVPISERSQFYYRFDPYREVIFMTEEDKFTELD